MSHLLKLCRFDESTERFFGERLVLVLRLHTFVDTIVAVYDEEDDTWHQYLKAAYAEVRDVPNDDPRLRALAVCGAKKRAGIL